ncbi:MAG: TIGR04283 family arsenosugar biosynthesis glycosyltransferase [Cyclobacteriaceae bacterium]|nr:TIGR04283 family arsenosugar biosynthesis glycosyltransferase [Cyclobacteriaceae bacterium]
MKISAIIPAFNEGENIGPLVTYIHQHGKDSISEVIVVDGQSDDQTVSVAQHSGAMVFISPVRSRAAQMNLGASHATGDILYFVHADVKPIESFASDIHDAIQSGYPSGCYRYRFDSSSRLLKANAYFTRFRGIMCRGGDQTLFIEKKLFHSLQGFDESFVIMEDYDFIQRIRKRNRFIIIPKYITVSARKYKSNSWLRVQVANLVVFILYFLRLPSKKLATLYKRMLNYG